MLEFVFDRITVVFIIFMNNYMNYEQYMLLLYLYLRLYERLALQYC